MSQQRAAAMIERMARVRERLVDLSLDALLCSIGADLPWLCGYEAMPLERLTMLVLPRDGEATLIVPQLEAPRVQLFPDCFSLRAWSESEDPVALVAALVAPAARLAVSERTWAAPLLDLQSALPRASWHKADAVTGPLRAVKDPFELETLGAAGAAADRVAVQLLGGEIGLVGRTEAEVSAEISDRLRQEGHQRVNFAIVACGPNSASPHHEPGRRRIGPGEAVVCDFGGSLSLDDGPGYCSDTTRTVVTGSLPAGFGEAYEVLRLAQAKAVAGALVGRSGAQVDALAREDIADAGFAEAFIHRTGHGIGLEDHEEPYIVSTNNQALVAGNAFSVEPGIYLAGRWGARIEDIVVATSEGPRPLNVSPHELSVVEA